MNSASLSRRLLSIVLATGSLTISARAATIVVDGSGGGDFLTIQQAINAANPGDVIQVKPGNYIEDLLVNEQVTIVSTNGAAVTIVLPSTSNPGNGGNPDYDTTTHLMRVTASNVTIDGMTLDGENVLLPNSPDARTGVIVDSRLGAVDNLVVKNCTIKNIHFRGVHASGSSSGVTVQTCTIDNIDSETGQSGAISVADMPAAISTCFMTNCLTGISLLSGSSGSLTSNTASGLPAGFVITQNTGAVNALTNKALGCTIGFQCQQNAANVTLDHGTATGCAKAFLLLGGTGPTAVVDVVGNAVDGLLVGSSVGVSTNTQYATGNGDLHAKLRQNTIKKTGNAVVIEEAIPSIAVSDVLVSGADADRNDFYSTISQMLKLVGTNDNINAKSNYWGTTDLSAIELLVTHKVDNPALGYVDFSGQLDGEPLVVLRGSNRIGEQVMIDLYGLFGENYILLLSVGGGNVPLPPFGTLLLSPALKRRWTSGSMPPSGLVTLTGTIPNDEIFVGLNIYFQNLVGFDIFNGVGSLSNAVVLSIVN
ncbi:MAG: hypothetical protein U1E76_17150 [Planctomycetota bacterium]